MRKIAWLILSCLMVLSLVLASCGPVAPEEEEVVVPEEEEEEEEEQEEQEEQEEELGDERPQYGGTITYCAGATVSSPNPMQVGPSIIHLHSLCRDRLGVNDWTRSLAGTGEFSFTSIHHLYPYVGALAESWEQPDPYTIVFHLRQGVKWQDKPPVSGREFVADDVVYALNNNFYEHPEVRIPLDAGKIESITALDKYTVEVKTNAIYAPALSALMVGDTVWMYPPEMEEAYGAGWTTVDGVCGTGPFVMTDLVSASSATFERNPDYWAYDELNPGNKLPYADGISYLMITDESTRLSALRTGKIDYMIDIGVDNAESLKRTNPDMEYYGYQWSMSLKCNMRADQEPYNDIRVRKAMNMAIDFQGIIDNYYGGQGVILNYPFTPEMTEVYTPLEELQESTREIYEYDPEKARQYLADAGYPDGFQTECITGAAYTEELQIMIAYWKAIGVDCEMRIVEPATYTNLAWGKKFTGMAFGASAAFTPLSGMEQKKSDAYFNYSFFNDPVFDEGVEQALETIDQAEQDRLVKELNLRYLSAATQLCFPSTYYYSFWWPWLKNYGGQPDMGSFNDGGLLARLWVNQELKKEIGY